MGRTVAINARAEVRMFLAANDKTQGWLAEQLDVHEATVSRWLSGEWEMSNEMAVKIAAITGVSLRRLLELRSA